MTMYLVLSGKKPVLPAALCTRPVMLTREGERPLGARISVGYRAAEGVDALSSPHGAGASVE